MSTFWHLAKLQLKVNFGLSVLRHYWVKRDKRLLSSLGIIALVVVGLIPIFLIYLRILNATFSAMVVFGQQHVVLTMAVALSSFLVFFMGIIFVTSAFFFAEDLPFLMSLPVRPNLVLGSKFFPVLVSEYLTLAPFMIPAVWVYGTRSHVGAGFYLSGLAVYALIPVVPLALATVAVLVIMTATGGSRRKDTLRLAGMIFTVAAALILNYLLIRIPQGQEMEYIQNILRDPDGLSRQIAAIYPPAMWAMRAMIGSGFTGILNLLGLAAIATLGIFIMMSVSQRVYYRSWARGQEIQRSRRLSGTEVQSRLSRSASPVWAIARREIKVLMRTPIYMFNSLAVLIIAPVSLILPLLSGDTLDRLMPSILDQDARPIVVLSAVGFVAFMSIFTPALSSSMSREGRTFWISKVIPLEPIVQLQGKLLSGYLISALSVPVVALTALLFPWTLMELAVVAIVGLVACTPVLVVSLFVDLLRPYLDWDNPQRAIKQNINVLFGMLAGAVVLAPAALAAYFGLRSGWLPTVVYIMVSLVSLGIGGVLYSIMKSMAARLYGKISV